jgi:predicted phage tail protein
MTEVKIHGYLSKIFGKSCIKVHLGRLSDLLSTLDSIIPNFRKKVLELHSKGFLYEAKICENTIHIIPFIIGSGGSTNLFYKILGITLIIIGIFTMAMGAPQIGFALINAGIQILVVAFKKPPKFNPITGNTGGSAAFVNAGGKSYIFSNPSNVASQGSLIPIGYGLMKASSKIIAVSIKNYKTSDTFNQENFFRFSEPENATFS